MGFRNNDKKAPKKNNIVKTFVNENQDIQEAIRVKAYELFLERNGAPGDPFEDWVAAERIVLKKFIAP
jgi:hypothetical protein